MAVLSLPFRFGCHFFLSFFLFFFFCLIAVAKASDTVLCRDDENGHLVLFLRLARRLSAFHCWVFMLAVDVLNGFYVEICSLHTQLDESFYHEWLLNFVKCFFCVYWDDHLVFVFSFVNVVYHSDWFVYVEPSLWPWNKSKLSMVYDPFYELLNFIC